MNRVAVNTGGVYPLELEFFAQYMPIGTGNGTTGSYGNLIFRFLRKNTLEKIMKPLNLEALLLVSHCPDPRARGLVASLWRESRCLGLCGLSALCRNWSVLAVAAGKQSKRSPPPSAYVAC